MKRYELKVVLRQWNPETDREEPEESLTARKTAPNEFSARRMVLDDAYQMGCLVSTFLSVKQLASK